jgi:hypothetical protein
VTEVAANKQERHVYRDALTAAAFALAYFVGG